MIAPFPRERTSTTVTSRATAVIEPNMTYNTQFASKCNGEIHKETIPSLFAVALENARGPRSVMSNLLGDVCSKKLRAIGVSSLKWTHTICEDGNKLCRIRDELVSFHTQPIGSTSSACIEGAVGHSDLRGILCEGGVF